VACDGRRIRGFARPASLETARGARRRRGRRRGPRGKQSAAILVVRGEPSARPWDDKLLELRVDDHPEPLAELRRLLELADGYRALLQLREGDPPPEAVAAVLRLPELDVRWSETYAALRDGDVEGARSLVRPLFGAEPRWRGYVASLAARGLLPHAYELLRE